MRLIQAFVNVAQEIQTLKKEDLRIPHGALEQTDIEEILQIAFGILGAVAFLIIVLGAFQYTLSRGDPKAISKSKNTIIYAVVGLIVSMSGYAIVTFVVGHL